MTESSTAAWNRRDAVNAAPIRPAAAIATGLASMVSPLRLSRRAPDGAAPIKSGTEPSARTLEQAASLPRAANVLGNVSLAPIRAIAAATTGPSIKAGESTERSAAPRFRP